MRVRPILFALFVAAGCSRATPPAGESSDPVGAEQAQAQAHTGGAPDVAKGKEIFAQRCVPCHGESGGGDGPASASLNPKPRRFTDPDWQNQVTDEYIEKIVKMGGAAVGKSAAMPSNPDLNDPTVVAGLRTVVRGFKPN